MAYPARPSVRLADDTDATTGVAELLRTRGYRDAVLADVVVVVFTGPAPRNPLHVADVLLKPPFSVGAVVDAGPAARADVSGLNRIR